MGKILLESVLQPGKTRLFTKYEARVLVRLGRWRVVAEAVPAVPAKAPTYRTRALEAERPAAVTPRARCVTPNDVDFAFDKAYEAARDAGLPASAFAGRTGTGHDGAFTKHDVLEIVKDWA